jgi:hypothetical protein
MHKYIFTDTNLFEQFQPIENIAWLELAEADTVTLIVPNVTLGELNKHKDGATRPRLKRRSAGALSQLSKLSRTPEPRTLRPGVDLAFRHQEPLIDFAAHHLSKDVADDRLLASAVEFALENNLPHGAVMITTGDLGLELKVKGQALIEPLLLPPELQLPDEIDPAEAKIIELETELKSLRASVPRLSLSFRNGANFFEIAVEGALQVDRDKVRQELEQLRCRYPLRGQGGGLHPAEAALIASSLGLDEYNQELRFFYAKTEKHYDEMCVYLNRQRLSVELGLLLHNDGGAPAEDVDVELHFPDGLSILDESSEETPPREPDPPATPEDRWMSGFRLTRDLVLPDISSRISALHPQALPNARLKGIKKTNSYLVTLNVKRLKHTLTEELPSVRFRFDSFESVRPFGIEYRIVAANLPVPVVGNLHVVAKVN